MANSELCCPRFNTEDFGQRDITLQLPLSSSARIHIETATVPGSVNRLNEDSFDFRSHGDGRVYAAVFDGTTSLKPVSALAERNVTTAQFASHFLTHEMPGVLSQSLRKTFLNLNRRLRNTVSQFGVDFSDPGLLPASTGTAVNIDFASGQFELAHVGDSFCIIRFNSGRTELLTENRNKKFDQKTISLLQEIASEKSITPREAKSDPRISEELTASFRIKMNNPKGEGIGIFNGDPNIAKYITYQKFPLEAIHSILLGTDGIILPGTDLDEKWAPARMMDLAQNVGVRGLVEFKRYLEDSDPDWNKYPRLKHSDDATVVYVSVSQRPMQFGAIN